jgi:tetratricopeptide (TPR) repeat protein
VYGRLGNLTEAEAKLRQAVAMQEKLLGAESSELAESLGNLGIVLAQRAQEAEGLAMIRRALALQEKLFGHESPEVARWLKKLGTVLEESDQAAEAVVQLREALAINKKLFGEHHPEVLSTMQMLGVALVGLNHYLEALELYVGAVGIRQRLPDAAVRATQNPTSALEQPGTPAELDRRLRLKVEWARKRYGNDSWQVAHWLAPRIYVLLLERKFEEAEPAARECLRIRQRLQPDDWSTFHAQSMLGGALAGQRRFDEAERWLLSGYNGLVRLIATLPVDHALRPPEAAKRLLDLYLAWGRPEKADEWRRKLAALGAVENKR